MKPTYDIRISAGRGPTEARRFVAMLTDALCERLERHDVTVLGREHHGDRTAPGRVRVQLDRDPARCMPELLGTHLLLAELRGPRARRRWFAAVEPGDEQSAAPVVLGRSELDIRFVRSRGPGGQNVNKRATAVQITHRPTSLSVFCDAHRSQARNRAQALANLRRSVTEHLHDNARQQQRTETWQAQRALLRSEPVMQWRLDPKDPDCVVPL
ncbi:MAG: peptide chain release factor-like protein [Myxococcota bacterium]